MGVEELCIFSSNVTFISDKSAETLLSPSLGSVLKSPKVDNSKRPKMKKMYPQIEWNTLKFAKLLPVWTEIVCYTVEFTFDKRKSNSFAVF